MQNLDSHIMEQYENFARGVRLKVYFAQKDSTSQSSDPFLRLKSKWQPPTADRPVEDYLSTVKGKLAEQLKLAKNNKHYLTRQYSPLWLPKALNSIKENKEIIVTEADKNMGVVVMKTSEYIMHGLKQLQDSKTYKSCDNINYPELWDTLELILAKRNFLFTLNQVGDFIYSPTAAYLLQLKDSPYLKLGLFYMLMKVHKPVLAGRPIVSSINTVTYHASKYIDHKLQPIYKSIYSYLKSSQDLLVDLDLDRYKFSEDVVILCADIDSLYPNIPITQGLKMMRESIDYALKCETNTPSTFQLYNDNEVDLLMDLMKFVLENNYFSFGNLQYQQIEGTAMGTPAAVVFACLFLDSHERQVSQLVLQKFGIYPLFYKRYIDDIFAIFSSRHEAKTFIKYFCNNKQLPTIKCSSRTISSTEGIFLDLRIFKGKRFQEEGKFDTTIYQKPQNKYLYLPPNSFHPKAVFPSYILSELNRYRLVCNNDDDFNAISEEFFTRLKARGYSDEFLNPIFQKTSSREFLFNKLVQRVRSKETQKTVENINLFKTVFNPQTKALKIKDSLKLTDSVLLTHAGKLACNDKDPIVCYSNSPNIQSHLSQTRKNLHNIILQHNISLNIVDIDRFIRDVEVRTEPTFGTNSREIQIFNGQKSVTDLTQRLSTDLIIQ